MGQEWSMSVRSPGGIGRVSSIMLSFTSAAREMNYRQRHGMLLEVRHSLSELESD